VRGICGANTAELTTKRNSFIGRKNSSYNGKEAKT
jgi:hypothetical protein